jgi:NAD(P)H dehydrogenase (quinone)
MEGDPMSTEGRVLITGATGKTGVHAVAALRERGIPVRALVHQLDERSQQLEDLGAELVQGDLLDFDAVSAAVAGVSAACSTRPPSSPRPPVRQACARC